MGTGLRNLSLVMQCWHRGELCRNNTSSRDKEPRQPRNHPEAQFIKVVGENVVFSSLIEDCGYRRLCAKLIWSELLR